MIITCKKATELIEKKDIFGLSKKEAFSLNVHTFLCKTCKKYEKLSEELDHTLRNFFSSQTEEELTLSPEKKEEIKNKLKNK